MPKLSDIARAIGADLDPAAPDREVRRVASLDEAGPDDLSYVTSDRYFDRLKRSRVTVLVAPTQLELPETSATVLRVADAELAIGLILELFAPPAARPSAGIDPSASIDPSVVLGDHAAIGANVSIAAGAKIGRNVVLHPGVVIGNDVTIGDDCELYATVVVRERCDIGHRVIIHANATIGSDGFGYRWDGKRHRKIPQIGTVTIEDDVEIGSNTCVDRAKFGVTRIGRGTKIDNLVQIGHNVTIGQHCILCGGVAVAGSVTIGNGVVMGGGSAASDHVTIADGVMLAARGAIAGQTKPREVLAGAPAIPHRDWLRERVNVGRLPELIKTLKRLEAEVAELREAKTPSIQPSSGDA